METTVNELVFGSCVIFTGIEKMREKEDEYYEDEDDYDSWILESDEETKDRLITGLLSVGIKCEKSDISIGWKNETDGTKFCKCKFYYRKLELDESLEIYINGLTSFGFKNCCPLELYIKKDGF